MRKNYSKSWLLYLHIKPRRNKSFRLVFEILISRVTFYRHRVGYTDTEKDLSIIIVDDFIRGTDCVTIETI